MVPASFDSPVPQRASATTTRQGKLKVEIEAASVADLAEASQLVVESFFGLAAPMAIAVTLGEHSRLAKNHGVPDHVQLVARCSGSCSGIVGYVDLDARPHRDPHRPYVSDLAVRPDCRRRGVATQLLLHCERVARDWGHRGIFLKVDADRRGALQLYANLGYELLHNDQIRAEATLCKQLTPQEERRRDEEVISEGEEVPSGCGVVPSLAGSMTYVAVL